MAAEKYPSKPVRIVVGFAPVGPVDNLSRITPTCLVHLLTSSS